jgi:uncharacterized membrane protein YccC
MDEERELKQRQKLEREAERSRFRWRRRLPRRLPSDSRPRSAHRFTALVSAHRVCFALLFVCCIVLVLSTSSEQ